ncbi:MAG: hypothetical protein HY927_01420 [Elusimicrobia bacterium]|nr:hypothetical protein [Elusimicrobiota bacterium]
MLPGEPETIRGIDDVTAIVGLALKLCGEGRTADGGRLMTRIWQELALADLKRVVEMSAGYWTESVKASVSPEALSRARESLRLAAEAAGGGKEDEALRRIQAALKEAPPNTAQHPMVPLLGLGLKGVAAAKAASPDGRYSALVNQAVEAMLRPDGKAEAARLFEQALALIPDPPASERDKTRRDRVTAMLSTLREDKPAPRAPAQPPAPAGPQAHQADARAARRAVLEREGMFWNPEDWRRKGLALLEEKDYELTLRCMDQVLAVTPGDLAALSAKGRACLMLARAAGNPAVAKPLLEAAIQSLRKALEHKPGDAEVGSLLAEAEAALKG